MLLTRNCEARHSIFFWNACHSCAEWLESGARQGFVYFDGGPPGCAALNAMELKGTTGKRGLRGRKVLTLFSKACIRHAGQAHQ